MKKYGNTRKSDFLDSIPKVSIENSDDKLTLRCKFNFAYFSLQEAGQDFCDWSPSELVELLNKLKLYSEQPLSYWQTLPIGSGRRRFHVLEIYDRFPVHSKFTIPTHIPHQALWGRFRLDSDIRLIGFVLPSVYHGKSHPTTGERFDKNTFYLVFLDKNHQFYPMS